MPKASNFISGRVQNRDTKNRRLGTIVTSIQDSKPREKQISQIVPSLLFLVSRFCTPPEVKFDAFGTSKHGKRKSLWKNFFAVLISTLERFRRANKKKICHIHFKANIPNTFKASTLLIPCYPYFPTTFDQKF